MSNWSANCVNSPRLWSCSRRPAGSRSPWLRFWPASVSRSPPSIRRQIRDFARAATSSKELPHEPLATLPAHLPLPGRGPAPPPHARQRISAVGAAGALGGCGRRIDRRNPGDPGGIYAPTAIPARGAAHRSRSQTSGAGRHRGLLRRPGDGAPGGLRLSLQAGHGSGPAGPLLRAADAAYGERSARRDHLRQAVVRPPAERRTGAGGLRGRDVGGHDQVLPGRLLQGDRRLRAPGDVGRHRLPPGPHARVDR